MATTPINGIQKSQNTAALHEAHRKQLEAEQADQVQNQQATPPLVRPTLNLFDKTTYEDDTSAVKMPDGSAMGLPTFSEEEKGQINEIIDSVPEDQRAAVNEAGRNLAQAVWNSTGLNAETPSAAASGASATPLAATTALNHASKQAVSPLSASKDAATQAGTAAPMAASTVGQTTVSQASPDVQNAFNTAAVTYANASPTTSYDSAVTRTALVGVMGLQSSLRDFASDMNDNVTKQQTLRADGSELSSIVSDWDTTAQVQQTDKKTGAPAVDKDGQPIMVTAEAVKYHTIAADGTITEVSAQLTKQQASDLADSAKNAVSTMSDATQMQMLQLQAMQQNYQQGVTTISNVMRTSYDMVKNTLQNIHY